jgi:hypothetical protein
MRHFGGFVRCCGGSGCSLLPPPVGSLDGSQTFLTQSEICLGFSATAIGILLLHPQVLHLLDVQSLLPLALDRGLCQLRLRLAECCCLMAHQLAARGGHGGLFLIVGLLNIA